MNDDLSFLVQETLRVNELRQLGEWEEEDGEEVWEPVVAKEIRREFPQAPGVLFHFVQQGGTFVVRTLASTNMAEDYAKISDHPEEYPTLRLIDAAGVNLNRLQYFICDSLETAEVIHARMGHRRFPCQEEEVCNLSDPGFSWWMDLQDRELSLMTKLSHLGGKPVRLGPIADSNIMPARWNELHQLLSKLPLSLELSVESLRFRLACGEDAQWLFEEIVKVFRDGVVSENLRDVFRLLSKRGEVHATLETCWFFLCEMAAVRRFWMEIEKRLE